MLTLGLLAAAALGPVALPWLEGTWAEATVLAHTLLGLAALAATAPWLVVHVRRTRGRDLGVPARVSLLATAALLTALGSGLWLTVAYVANLYGTDLVEPLHLVLGYATLALVPLHLFSSTALRSHQRLRRRGLAALGLGAALCAGLSWLLVLGGGWPEGERPVDPGYVEVDDAGPFFPSGLMTTHGGFYELDAVANDEGCSPCHAEIVQEAAEGVHRFTGVDNAIVATGYAGAHAAKGRRAARFCASCHEPVALLTGAVDDDLLTVEPAYRQHGTSCLVCHGVQRVDRMGGQILEPPDPSGFFGAETAAGRAANRLLVRSFVVRHRNEMGSALLATPEVCSGCHNVNANEGLNGWGWFPLHNEYGNWTTSMFAAGVGEEQRVLRCQDCHMFLVEGSSDPVARRRDGRHRSHRFLAANTWVALHHGGPEQLALTESFLTGDLVRDELTDVLPPGPVVSMVVQSAERARAGEVLSVSVGLYNRAVGHGFPEGAIEVHDTWLELTASDGSGRVVFASGLLNAEGLRDPSAWTLTATPVDRDGEEITLTGGLAVAFADKNSILSGQARDVAYRVPLPPDLDGPLQLRARLRYRRVDDAFRAHMATELEVPVTDVATASTTVQVERAEG